MNRRRVVIIISIAAFLLWSSTAPLPGGRVVQNDPPVVRFLKPADRDVFSWNTLIRYAIEVSDKEDGLSKYGEIASQEVFVEVTYFPQTQRPEQDTKTAVKDAAGLALIKRADCFSCHASQATMTGPSFLDIAGRYASEPGVAGTLGRRIVNGSQGIWGNVPMPPHPSLSEEQARQMAAWILECGGDPDYRIFRGLEGVFRTRQPPKSGAAGWYRLSVSYTDHGLEGQAGNRKQGRHTIVLTAR